MADENTTTTSENSGNSEGSTTKAADLKKGNAQQESSDSGAGDTSQYIEYFVDKAAEKISEATGGNSIVNTIVSLLKNLLFGSGLPSLTGGNPATGNTISDKILPGVTVDNPFTKRTTGSSNWSFNDATLVPEYHNVYKIKYVEPEFKAVVETDEFKKDIYNQNTKVIQNKYLFPREATSEKTMKDDKVKKYDYQILVGDPNLELSKSLEDKLQEFRASVGLTVHGSNRIARAMKYYMYNRYKVPDTNLAHVKTFTHIFFTRPDLNLLEKSGASYTANKQIRDHSDASLYWRKYPDLFKLLTESTRCGDTSNLNLLLSNQIQSFEPKESELQTENVGRNWNDYTILYGNAYTNKTGNDFTCEFIDTSNLEIMHLLKLWMLYIDNVSRGAWKPSYDLPSGECGRCSVRMTDSHVYQRTLDYAASAYMFKVGPDGEDILYWTKYYGVFPLNDGSNILQWTNTPESISQVPKLSIKFAYSFKRDMSPLSIVEFNNNSGFLKMGDGKSTDSYSKDYNESTRPFVGVPYVEVVLGNPILNSDDVSNGQDTHLRLKFLPDKKRDDKMLYRPIPTYLGEGKADSKKSYNGIEGLADQVAKTAQNALTQKIISSNSTGINPGFLLG